MLRDYPLKGCSLNRHLIHNDRDFLTILIHKRRINALCRLWGVVGLKVILGDQGLIKAGYRRSALRDHD